MSRGILMPPPSTAGNVMSGNKSPLSRITPLSRAIMPPSSAFLFFYTPMILRILQNVNGNQTYLPVLSLSGLSCFSGSMFYVWALACSGTAQLRRHCRATMSMTRKRVRRGLPRRNLVFAILLRVHCSSHCFFIRYSAFLHPSTPPPKTFT